MRRRRDHPIRETLSTTLSIRIGVTSPPMVAAAIDTAFTMDIGFEIDGCGPLHVARLDGSEALSELFHFHLTLRTEPTDSALSGVVGSAAVLTLGGVGDPRQVHGIISQFRQGASTRRHVVYHATLVPKVFRLLHRFDARIFQENSTPEIVELVLKDAGITTADYRLSLEQSYAPRDYCVQYRESDWCFIARLLEEEGLFYFFEQGEKGTVLVIADGSSAHAAIGAPSTIPFHPPGGAMIRSESVSALEAIEQMHPGKVTLRDYDFTKPGLSLESNASGERHADLEVFHYPGGYGTPTTGDRLARVRTEEHHAGGRTIEGETSCTRLAPGSTFTLEEHPLAELNTRYVISSIQHEGTHLAAEAGPPYAARFSAFAEGVPFRAPRLTPKPALHAQTAIVVGPPGVEIHTDKHGRVKVQFHWDRKGKKDEKSSTWIRVSQAWAGSGFGAMALPRVGQEVIVDFLDGDADRPIIVGRVYHGTNTPPYSLPANKTRSTMKSLSSPEGEAGNELRFEDKKGDEEVYLHAQKDLLVVVENDRKETVGKNMTITVEGDSEESVTGKKTIEVKGDKFEITCGQSKVKITQSSIEIESPEVKVKGMTSVTMQGESKVDIKASGEISVKADGQVTVKASGICNVKGASVKVN